MNPTTAPDASLSDVARQLAECYAVVHPEAPGRSKVAAWLNAARKAASGARGLKPDETRAAVEECVAAGVLLPATSGGGGQVARGPVATLGSLARLCEGALGRGTARTVLDALEAEAAPIRYGYGRGRTHALPYHLEAHVRLALIEDRFERFADAELPDDVWTWLTEPRAKPYLARLPERHRRAACDTGLRVLTWNLLPLEAFSRTCEELAPDPGIAALRAVGLVLRGRFDEAGATIGAALAVPGIDKPAETALHGARAMGATLLGDDAAAVEAVEAAVEAERRGTRKRNLYPGGLPFEIALVSLVRAGTPEARARFAELLTVRAKLKVRTSLGTWLHAADQADRPAPIRQTLQAPGAPPLLVTLLAIASRWHERYRYRPEDAPVIESLERAVRTADAGGHAWAVAELQTVLEASVPKASGLSADVRALFAERSAEERHAALGSRTLTRLVRQIEPWEHALRELEQLALSARATAAPKAANAPGATKRLVWQVGSDGIDDETGVTPLEQSRNRTGGWTAGRRVSLKRLLEQRDEVAYLTEHDVKVCQSIRKVAPSGWYGGAPSYEVDERTLYRLAGHPLVVDEDGERVDVVEAPARLHVERGGGSTTVKVLPGYTGAHYRARFDADARRLEVTHFDASRRRVAEALPRGGLKIPDGAGERLERALAALAADIPVHGDERSGDGPVVPGDPRPLLVLEPAGEGLRVRVRVEPLEGSGIHFDAGSGGAVVYVQTPEGTRRVRRDLDAERAAMGELASRSTVLAERFDGRPYLSLDDATVALELLDEVQEAGIRCVWPGDVPFRIRSRASASQVSLEVKSAKEWFGVAGSIDAGDAEPMPLERLLELMRRRPGSRFVDLGRGEFLALSRTLKRQLDTLRAYAQPGKAAGKANDKPGTEGANPTARVHPLALLSLDPLLDGAALKADAGWKRLRARVREANGAIPDVPPTLEADLRGYQQDGFAWLARLGALGAGACLADDMGLGKTVQTLAVLLHRADGGPALVVAPTSVVGNWRAEAGRFAPSLNVVDYAGSTEQRAALLGSLGAFDLVIASYGLLANDADALAGVRWHTAVLDEAQAIKNAATRRAKAARALNADFRVATTGTPVQNSLLDLHSLFGFLNPRLLGGEAAFRKRYALPIARDDDGYAREQLQRLVSPFLLRRHKRDVLTELPARTELRLDVELSPEERALYEALRVEALDALEDPGEGDAGQHGLMVLAYLTKLRRACCNPALVAPGWTGPMSKLDVFTDTLDELIAGGHKALVFSQFVDHLKIVEAALGKRGVAYQYLDGATPAKRRTERVAAFQRGQGDVFLISLTAGGTGLNLTAADYVVHLDPWWNPAVEDQASDRAHRLGQRRPVTILRMVTAGTIEERIQELHGTKRALADSVLAGTGNASLDAEALLALLRG